MRGCRSSLSLVFHRTQVPLPGCPDPSVAALQQLLEPGYTGRERGTVWAGTLMPWEKGGEGEDITSHLASMLEMLPLR